MEIIEIPEEEALVTLSTIEIRALWKTLRRALEDMEENSFRSNFDMTKDAGWKLDRTLSEALDAAQGNGPRD
jgi:hypothetical protein